MTRRGALFHATAEKNAGQHWVVEGQAFCKLTNVMTAAVSRGYDGAPQTLRIRLASGVNTWDELCRPVDKARQHRGAHTGPRNRDDVLAAIDAVESRKRAIAEANREPEE